jgi:hypothetical protein
MSRQTRNSKVRLEESTQTTPSLSRYAKREAATSPIKMSNNENNVDDIGGAAGGEEHAAADLLHIPDIAIPDGIDPATANLLKMQMTMMQTLMATQLAQMEKRLDYKTRERRLLARELAKCDSVTPKIMGKAPLFDIEKDRGNFKTWKLKWKDFLVSSNINAIEKAAVKEEQMKAALTASLSNDTLKWLNGQGFSLDDLGKADFIIETAAATLSYQSNLGRGQFCGRGGQHGGQGGHQQQE